MIWPSFPRMREPSAVGPTTLDPRLRGDDAVSDRCDASWTLDPRLRGDDAAVSDRCDASWTLDPRLRGDDAAVSDRCDASRLALGHPRHLTSGHSPSLRGRNAWSAGIVAFTL